MLVTLLVLGFLAFCGFGCWLVMIPSKTAASGPVSSPVTQSYLMRDEWTGQSKARRIHVLFDQESYAEETTERYDGHKWMWALCEEGFFLVPLDDGFHGKIENMTIYKVTDVGEDSFTATTDSGEVFQFSRSLNKSIAGSTGTWPRKAGEPPR